jgi:hypothetical protein
MKFINSSIKPILTSLFVGLSVCLVLALSGFGGHQKVKLPNPVLAIRDTVALPLEGFSTAQLQAQEQANSQESAIRCFVPIDQQNNYEGIDNQDITPKTWRWVRLEHQKPDGSQSIISLRRPNAWLLALGADAIGKQIHIDLPEMGIVGNARVMAFAPNGLDTRLWHENRNGSYIDRPITGKFEHQSPVVLWLTCPDLEPIGTTPTHPFWSEDRQQWVRANDLRIGEHLRTQHGQTVLTHKRIEHKPTTVYNLEVYRNHNYLVSSDGILVHNDCPDVDIKFENNPKHVKKDRAGANKAPENPDITLENSFQVSENSTRRVGVDMETGEFNIFDEHTEGVFHGHSRSWNELSQAQKNVLIKNKVVNVKGKILKSK